jgi:hypothetical protein
MRKLASSVWDGFTAAIGSPALAASIRRGPILSLILCGGLLVAAIIVGTVMMVGEFRERTLSNTERELENTVLLLARHFEQQFEDADVITNNLIAQLQFSGIASPEIFERQMSTPEAHLMFQSKVGMLSPIVEIKLFDARGTLINSSRVWRCRPSALPSGPISRPSNRIRLKLPWRASPHFHRQLDHCRRPQLTGPNGSFSA